MAFKHISKSLKLPTNCDKNFSSFWHLIVLIMLVFEQLSKIAWLLSLNRINHLLWWTLKFKTDICFVAFDTNLTAWVVLRVCFKLDCHLGVSVFFFFFLSETCFVNTCKNLNIFKKINPQMLALIKLSPSSKTTASTVGPPINQAN